MFLHDVTGRFSDHFRIKDYLCNLFKSLMTYLSIGSAETKYIKLNTKTQNIFCCLNKNLVTFYTLLTGGQENRRRKKFSFLKCIQKLNVIKKNLGFSI